jgi:ribonuclease P/MRP protein subunit RPP40
LDNNIISTVDSARDLGVIVNTSLNPHEHIAKIVSQAFVRVNLILKCFLSKDVRTLTRAFISYVRPLLEYASVSWSPYHTKDIELLESVQRKFTKRLLVAHGTRVSYPERLKLLNLESLELRRLRCDLIYTYKLLFGLISTDASDFFTLSSNGHYTRGHAYKLSMSYSRLDIRKFYFSQRVIEPWNSLPAESEHFSSLKDFKSFLSGVDLSRFLNV